jgi:integrase
MLSDARARKIKPDDKPMSAGVVPGLFLFPSALGGQGKWVFRFVSPVTGKRRDMGLGTYPSLGIANARTAAFKARELISTGSDPIEVRRQSEAAARAESEIPTFQDAATSVHCELRSGFRNPKHADQWINTLRTYVFPKIGSRLVSELKAADFAAALKPIWLTKPETASRVRQRCDVVMNWCAAREYLIASPLGVIDALLPRQPGKRERVEHHPAVPWRIMPAIARKLFRNTAPTNGRLALEFLILTACRSGEVREMVWQEIDFKEQIWLIPATRMKAKVSHSVPLSKRALEILAFKASQQNSCPFVFPSTRQTPLSDATLTKILSDAGIGSDVAGRTATAHGFRSTFRDWASENGYARDLAERALAHTIQSSTEAAYHRTDLLAARRPMMESWAAFFSS